MGTKKIKKREGWNLDEFSTPLSSNNFSTHSLLFEEKHKKQKLRNEGGWNSESVYFSTSSRLFEQHKKQTKEWNLD